MSCEEMKRLNERYTVILRKQRMAEREGQPLKIQAKLDRDCLSILEEIERHQENHPTCQPR